MGTVRIRFLGSGDAFASGGRLQACLHLTGGGEPLLLDCGATGLVALKRGGIDPAGIGWVALSHLHGDHYAGLPFLILDGQFSRRSKPLVIAGPEGTQQRLEQAFEALYPGSWSAERPFETRYATLEPGKTCQLGTAAVTPFSVQHESGAAAYAMRVEYGGKVIAYSGDTEWSDGLVEAARGADLLVCEANFFDKQIPGHIDYRTLAARREELDCGRIVLTHLGQQMLDHLDEVEIEVAADGGAISV